MRFQLLRAITIAYGLALAFVTLTPQGAVTASPLETLSGWLDAWWWLAWLTVPVLESLANVVLFMPFGFLGLAVTQRPWWIVGLVGFVATAAIELAQNVIPGRVPDIRDVVANTLGTVIGTAAQLALGRRHRTR